MRVVQQPQMLGLPVTNDVLLAPQERMTMQIAVDGATLLQQQAEWHLVDIAAPCHEDSCTNLLYKVVEIWKGGAPTMGKS